MKKRKRVFYTSLCIVLLFAILLLGGFFLKKKKTEEMPQIEAQIREYKGYTRVIGREEYEFYKSLAERENPEEENQVAVRSKVIYEVTLNGERETVTADREQLNFLGKADMGLVDFLETGKVNDVYQDWYDNQSRQVVIKQVEEKVGKFEDNKDVVIYNYIRTELYPDLIQTVAEQNPVQFE